MEIEYRYGDILKTETKYICQGVNAQGVMGAGLAKQIREKYPKVYTIYRKEYEKYNKLALGRVIGVDCGKHIILNLVSQKYYGREPGTIYTDYMAIRRGLNSINKNINEPVSFPTIGCGLAGGNWDIIKNIIEEESTNFQAIVYLLDDEVPY